MVYTRGSNPTIDAVDATIAELEGVNRSIAAACGIAAICSEPRLACLLYTSSAKQVAEFQRNGHILLRSIASSDEVAAYRSVILTARERFGAERTPLENRDTYGKAFLKGMNLWPRDEGVRRFVLAARFAKIAADLLGVEGVRVYHDQALLKEPGGGITPWHQDQHYWPLDTDNTITMWMPLVDVSPGMGAMRLSLIHI